MSSVTAYPFTLFDRLLLGNGKGCERTPSAHAALPTPGVADLSTGAGPARAAAPASETRQGLVLPEHLEALEETGRHLGSRYRQANRLKRVPRLEPELGGEPPQRLFDYGRLERLDGLEGLGSGRQHLAVDDALWFDAREEEARERRKLA